MQYAAVVASCFRTSPNPFSSAFTLSFEARATGACRLSITDVLGRPVVTYPVVVRPGINSQTLALPNEAPGLYLLSLEVGETCVVTRIA
jgi:hypothetical protein